MAHIFISYSHDDSDYAHRLAKALKKQGLLPWIDDRMDYGTEWPHVIQEHLDECIALVLIMTPRAYQSKWVQNELSRAMRKGKPVFPLLLDDEPWLSVESIQYVDVRGNRLPPADFYSQLKAVGSKIGSPVTRAPQEGESGTQRLVSASERRVTQAPVSNIRVLGGMEFLRIPAGKFLMGSKKGHFLGVGDDEKPQRMVEIPYDYWLARYPVTNDQFAAFIEATQHVTTAEKEGGWSNEENKYVKGFDWRHPQGPKSGLTKKGDHPVVQVSWHDAMAYCHWLNQELHGEFKDLQMRLPTEAEWERPRAVHMAMNGRGAISSAKTSAIRTKVARGARPLWVRIRRRATARIGSRIWRAMCRSGVIRFLVVSV